MARAAARLSSCLRGAAILPDRFVGRRRASAGGTAGRMADARRLHGRADAARSADFRQQGPRRIARAARDERAPGVVALSRSRERALRFVLRGRRLRLVVRRLARDAVFLCGPGAEIARLAALGTEWTKPRSGHPFDGRAAAGTGDDLDGHAGWNGQM